MTVYDVDGYDRSGQSMSGSYVSLSDHLEANAGLIRSGNKMAHELRIMLSIYPDRRGGLYEKALHEWEITNGYEPTVFQRKDK